MRMIDAGLLFFSVIFWMFFFVGIFWLISASFLLQRGKVINVLSWGDMIDSQTISEFYRATGIRVHVHAYSSHKELLVTVQMTKCRGYDLIVVSDSLVEILRKQGLIKKLDAERTGKIKDRINPVLLNHYFDKNNDYTLPYNWEIFAL